MKCITLPPQLQLVWSISLNASFMATLFCSLEVREDHTSLPPSLSLLSFYELDLLIL